MSEFKIGNDLFSVSPLSWGEAWPLQMRLWPIVAELISGVGIAAASALADGKRVEDLDVEKILPQVVPAITRISQMLTADELSSLTKALLKTSTVNGMPLFTPNGNPFDAVMRGRTMDTWRLLFYAVKVNFPDFFGLGAGAASVGASPAGSPSAK